VNGNLRRFDRRWMLSSFWAAGVALDFLPPKVGAAIPDVRFDPTPLPDWAPFEDGVAEVNGSKLYYRDSGGPGVPIVLLHPSTIDALAWTYQQPEFVRAGYRVIAYSRRGYGRSPPTVGDEISVPSRDLAALLDVLRIKRFVIVAAAAGSSIALDFAMDHSDRLHAIVVASGSFSRTDDEAYQAAGKGVWIEGLNQMPAAFRELGPSYRAANPDGVRRWMELVHQAASEGESRTKMANPFNPATYSKIRAPTLFIAGGADLEAPPTLMRLIAGRVMNSQMIVMDNVGHSVYWEGPAEFNRTVLDFLAKHNTPGG
jgi:pimeloyl-ACP methyl ester carboxylesterase